MLDPPATLTNIQKSHAIIARDNGTYAIEDGNGEGGRSRNGVFVNDQQIPFPGRRPLRDKDVIRICDFRCEFHADEREDFSVEMTLDQDRSVQSLLVQPAQPRQQDLGQPRQVIPALLPQGLPNVPGYEFFAYYESAHQLGGEYYDFIPLPGQRLAVRIGGVAGKGVAAALLMIKFSVAARVCLERENDLATAVSKLNTLLSRPALMDRFVILAAMVLDPATHTVTLVSAGHSSPLLTRHLTRSVEDAVPRTVIGLPLGIEENFPYQTCQIQLLPGDGLFLFDDSVTQALNARGECFGMERVGAVLKGQMGSRREIGEHFIQAVKRHTSGRSQFYGITLVCFGRSCVQAS
jgi:phosphoserine phosphatase RsbU/P